MSLKDGDVIDSVSDDEVSLNDEEKDGKNVRRFTTIKNSANDNIKNNSLQNKSKNDKTVLENIECKGILEIISGNNFGFLRTDQKTFRDSHDDIYVSPFHIKNSDLRTGDIIAGIAKKNADKEKFNSLYEIETINGIHLNDVKKRINFETLTPIHPNKQIKLSTTKDQISTRIIDLFSPIGFGQRGIIVAPPKSGKTRLLKDIAYGILKNHPGTILIFLLICERPEEVTEITRFISSITGESFTSSENISIENGTVIASTFDETAERQIKVSILALEKAKRKVEEGKDVIILMDSITRLARANNCITPSSGRILTGGIEMNSLTYPKKFFGAARNIENGGSLTIIATALVDTGSKMDDVIFEEFKGTGNMEIQLDRNLANRRIFPAIDVLRSGTRRDDLLLDPNFISRIEVLRRYLAGKTTSDVIEFLKNKMEVTNDNNEFLSTMNS